MKLFPSVAAPHQMRMRMMSRCRYQGPIEHGVGGVSKPESTQLQGAPQPAMGSVAQTKAADASPALARLTREKGAARGASLQYRNGREATEEMG